MLNDAFQKDVITKYRKELWSPFIKAIKKYKLIDDGDKIAVAISGGKDSLLLARLLMELQKHPHIKFELEFISMDPGFNKMNYDLLVENSKKLSIDVSIYESRVFEITQKIAADYPCYMCARLRRGFLYSKAKELGCNKLALGHHLNDVIETSVMNIMYAGTIKTMLPKLKADNFEDMVLIRPMYFIKEKNISRIMKAHEIFTMDCGCEIVACNTSSKRQETKQLIKHLIELNPDAEKNILRAFENVNLDSIYKYIKDGVEHTIYDNWE